MRARTWAAAVAVLTTACAGGPTLKAAPEAQARAGHAGGLVAAERGIELIARAGAWRGRPSSLSNAALPLLVTVRNSGAEAVLIRYADFALVDAQGTRFGVLPPYELHSELVKPVQHPHYRLRGLQVASHLGRYYPALRTFSGPFGFDPAAYARAYERLRERVLPTGDMARRALPEGLLPPGGEATGFLYFELVSGARGELSFEAAFSDPAAGHDVAILGIAFQVSD